MIINSQQEIQWKAPTITCPKPYYSYVLKYIINNTLDTIGIGTGLNIKT
jgi:hypothetical protein